jgi:hypothetical protein
MGQFLLRRIQVSNPPAFRETFEELVTAIAAQVPGGSRGPSGLLRAAPEFLPLSRSTVHRWLQGGVRQVNADQWEALLAVVDRIFQGAAADRWLRRLKDTVNSGGVLEALRQHQAWCRARFESMYVDRVGRWLEENSYTERHRAGDEASVSRRSESTAALEAAMEKCGPQLRSFAKWLSRNGIEPVRRAVAMLRLLEPLLHCADTAFVERHWSSLTKKEWNKFIAYGIKREKIALKRPPDRKAARMADDGQTTPENRPWSWYEENPLNLGSLLDYDDIGRWRRSTLAVFTASADERVAARVTPLKAADRRVAIRLENAIDHFGAPTVEEWLAANPNAAEAVFARRHLN